MHSQQCRFCQYSKQSLYANTPFENPLTNDMTITIQASLYQRHGQSQHFFYTRPIRQLLRKERTVTTITFKDQDIFDQSDEYLKCYNQKRTINSQLLRLSNFYKFNIDHPILFLDEFKMILSKYYQKRGQVEYDWAVKQIDKEQNKIQVSPTKKVQKTPVPKLELSNFLQNISNTQHSLTIMQILNNIKTDQNNLELDFQRRGARSLAEQDEIKTQRFTSYLNKQIIKPPLKTTRNPKQYCSIATIQSVKQIRLKTLPDKTINIYTESLCNKQKSAKSTYTKTTTYPLFKSRNVVIKKSNKL